MKQTRNKTFETNSSSTHTVTIGHLPSKIKHIDFKIGNFSSCVEREYENHTELMASYLYTTILRLDYTKETVYYLLRLQELLKAKEITFTMENFKELGSNETIEGYYPYIEDDSTKETVLSVLENADTLINYFQNGDLEIEYDG